MLWSGIKVERWQVSTLVILVLCNLMIWYVLFAEDRSGLMTVAFLDVGQGDAIYIESPSGNQVLIDGGPDRSVLKELSRVMPFYDRSLDLVVVTHADADHIGGLPYVLESYGVGTIIESGFGKETPVYEDLVHTKLELDLESTSLAEGDSIDLGSGAYLYVLYPALHVEGLDANTSSYVLRLVYGDTAVMLTGDTPQSVEERLVSKYGKGLGSDILKLGHHGSRTSSSEFFVGVVGPELAVVSAGADNRYGHPHPETLKTLGRFEVPTLHTADRGSIILRSDGVNMWLD